MATVNFRVDEALKEKSYSILREHGIAPTEFFTNVLEYVAMTGTPPARSKCVCFTARHGIAEKVSSIDYI
ncbi:type II toxin-antitoxin system RelB/DinJ family antitoxin [Acinetobacter rudis]|uniref:type II toxin-antitoxin system RelB/DinJ family antitoxin n=1 Tax=Acinetobacter rudis TaxID=632955 RepID=UPI0028104352|nr:type II toxin-antitoxin system RelB/DinJ family antitoxin [Acinetobacter rudis]MDQ8952101.1 type II toxin-antitoxin system RelB/DinJ family antitoxin [Acinetobacter rudis]